VSANGDRTVIPSARRLMTSLRDMGYDCPAAIADLVDNSIDADADAVEIDLVHLGEDSWIRIADDGMGMTARELDEAMRYGSAGSYSPRALGSFGLGLKTASLSQCRRLTVAARSTPRARIEIRRWDLDHVARQDAWVLERLTPSQCPEHLIEPLLGSCGTVVLWEHLDRVLGYRRPNGAAAARGLESLTSEVAEHLAMAFHRFLAGEGPRRRRVRITVDGIRLKPWDPFARSEPLTQTLPRLTVPLTHGGRRFRIPVRPYVLPTQIHFSSPEAHAAAAGPQRWNRQQGLYIYRNGRMIQSGGWNRLRTTDEHSKLARVALDIPPGADAAFGTSVSKMSVILPTAIRGELQALLSGVVTRAQDAYRQRIRLVPTDSEELPREGSQDAGGGWSLNDHWPVIMSILERELGEQPEILRRVLVALANAEPGPDERTERVSG
jgi:histidine kinase/DNA gyrase B/HSP90-like ATPase